VQRNGIATKNARLEFFQPGNDRKTFLGPSKYVVLDFNSEEGTTFFESPSETGSKFMTY